MQVVVAHVHYELMTGKWEFCGTETTMLDCSDSSCMRKAMVGWAYLAYLLPGESCCRVLNFDMVFHSVMNKFAKRPFI